jgi:hypothetical protein
MSGMNFIQGNTAQKWIWSRLLPRYTHKDSIEIYFIFFPVLLYFLCILEVYTNLRNFKRKWKNKNSVHSDGPASAHGLALLAQPSQESSPWRRRCARAERSHRAGFRCAVVLWRQGSPLGMRRHRGGIGQGGRRWSSPGWPVIHEEAEVAAAVLRWSPARSAGPAAPVVKEQGDGNDEKGALGRRPALLKGGQCCEAGGGLGLRHFARRWGRVPARPAGSGRCRGRRWWAAHGRHRSKGWGHRWVGSSAIVTGGVPDLITFQISNEFRSNSNRFKL